MLGIIIITGLGPTQPPTQLLPGAFSLGVKRPGRGAEVQKTCIYTFTPPYVFMALLSTGTTLTRF
jgi:hypothetical protein